MSDRTVTRVAGAQDVAAGEDVRVEVDGAPVCLVNLGEAGFRAVGDVCSHAEAFLHEGDVDIDDETVECPKHGSAFDLNTGAARSLPATHPVPAYVVTTEGDDILIEVK